MISLPLCLPGTLDIGAVMPSACSQLEPVHHGEPSESTPPWPSGHWELPRRCRLRERGGHKQEDVSQGLSHLFMQLTCAFWVVSGSHAPSPRANSLQPSRPDFLGGRNRSHPVHNALSSGLQSTDIPVSHSVPTGTQW